MKKKQKIKTKIDWNIIFISVLSFIMLFTNVNFTFSLADSSIVYTPVLTDLQKDKSFSIEDYPLIDHDYSLSVIQIAESVNKELFIYVYQPCKYKTLKASYISMSTTAVLDNKIYELELLNNDNSLYKYKVKDFIVSQDETRQYDIASIYRPFDDLIDEQPDNDNTITNVVFPVAKTWYATTYNGKVVYQTFDSETIEITDKYVGYVRYPDGFALLDSSCDSHFVAFSTDKSIDRLYEAKVFYTTQSYRSWANTNMGIGVNPPAYYYKFGDKTPCEVKIDNSQKVKYTSHGWVRFDYSWDRISSVGDFIENVNNVNVYKSPAFNVETETKIKPKSELELINKQWVLRFTETPYTAFGYDSTRTMVGNVSILQLKFETDGKVYDLGVVDNMQTGSDEPININKTTIDIHWWWIIALAIIIGLCVAFPAILVSFLGVIFKIFKYIFKILWWLITAPFALIGDDKCSKK